MAMDSFSYIDNVRAAFASCLPCFAAPRSESSTSNSTPNPPSSAVNVTQPDPRPARSSSFNDLEHLLHDSDSDALSLHSNLGSTHRRTKHRRRPKFSLTLFGYTLFGRPPIHLPDDDNDENDPSGRGGMRTRALVTASSSTLDSDAAPLDASTIERLTSPDHFAALAAQRESEQRRFEAEEEARRRAERRARRQARKARERAEALASLHGTSPRADMDTFEGIQESGSGTVPSSLLFHPAVDVLPDHLDPDRLGPDDDPDSHLDDADDADLGGELYTRAKKKSSIAHSASGSDSRSRTSASLSVGDASHTQGFSVHSTHQSIPYPHAEMHLPAPVKQRSLRASKRTSTVSSATSQSASTAPYTPVETITDMPAVAAFPVSQERYMRDGGHANFPSAGLSGKRGRNSLDPRAFLAHQG